MRFEGMLHAALRFSDHPRARVISIDAEAALAMEGVLSGSSLLPISPVTVIPVLYFSDWPLMIAPGETTRYIGDVIVGVVAINEETARKAAQLIRIEYEILEPVSDVHRALEVDSPQVHPGRSNLAGKLRDKERTLRTGGQSGRVNLSFFRGL